MSWLADVDERLTIVDKASRWLLAQAVTDVEGPEARAPAGGGWEPGHILSPLRGMRRAQGGAREPDTADSPPLCVSRSRRGFRTGAAAAATPSPSIRRAPHTHTPRGPHLRDALSSARARGPSRRLSGPDRPPYALPRTLRVTAPQSFNERPGVFALMRLATMQVRLWESRTAEQERAFRREERRTGVHRAMQLQRCAGELLRTLLLRHPSIGAVLAPVATRPRWQRWFSFATCVLAVFTVNIWLFYQK